MLLWPLISRFWEIKKAPITWIIALTLVAFFLFYKNELDRYQERLDLAVSHSEKIDFSIQALHHLKLSPSEESLTINQMNQEEDFLNKFFSLALADDALVPTNSKLQNYLKILKENPRNRFEIDASNIWSDRVFKHVLMHDDYLHLFGNVLYLLIFGTAVEVIVGSLFFLGFTIMLSVLSSLATVYLFPHVGSIGASGVISGLLGMWFIFQGRAPVRFFYLLLPLPIRGFYGFFSGPAWFAVGELLLVSVAAIFNSGSRMDYLSHLTGFAWGALLAILFKTSLDGQATEH